MPHSQQKHTYESNTHKIRLNLTTKYNDNKKNDHHLVCIPRLALKPLVSMPPPTVVGRERYRAPVRPLSLGTPLFCLTRFLYLLDRFQWNLAESFYRAANAVFSKIGL